MSQPNPTPEAETPPRWTLGGVVKVVLIVYAALVGAPLVIGLIAAGNDPLTSAQRIGYLRDLLWVIVLLLTVPLLIGFGVLLVQLAALFGVIRVDLGGVFGDLRGALKAITGVVRFAAETMFTPVIRFSAIMTGIVTFLRELRGLFGALRRKPTDPSPDSDETTPEE